MFGRRLGWAVWGLGILVGLVRAADDEPPARSALMSAVRRAFQDVHDGWSADEVLVQDDLNAAFLRRCRELAPTADAGQCNWMLLNLRKSGKLDVPTTQRDLRRHDAYFPAAEIAARFLYDRHQLTIDRILCEPERRREFDELAQELAPGVPADRLRKAALGLRKARELRPELVTRVADWGREIVSHSARQIVENPQLVPARPGVYVFRDATGYLYIGESVNLRTRVTKHLNQSDRESLAQNLWKDGIEGITVELHAFDPDSQARSQTVRRAYESELIRSRRPRLNIAP
jgi:hypothetical protein